MKIITQRSLILKVAYLWARQFPMNISGPDKADIGRRLSALNLKTASAEEVEAIIGNFTWTRVWCNECKTFSKWGIQFGDEPDYESATATVCRRCFRKAIQLVKEDHG